MKPQEIFNKAAVHLMGMEGPSLDKDNDACAYRGKDEDCEFNGQMCAVGLFIADEHYYEDFEGCGIAGGEFANIIAAAVAKSWGQDDLTDEQIRLLIDLQNAHDEASRPTSRGFLTDLTWSQSIVAALEGVATKFHLRFDPKGASA